MTSDEFADRLTARAVAAGISIPDQMLPALEAYYRKLSAWNEKMNLTAMDLRSLPPDTIDRLFIEPIVAARFVPPAMRVIDIGSGGGSPAIPFAVAARAASLVMVESKTRKSVFLREAARAAGLLDVTVINERVEDLVADSRADAGYDLLTIRAVKVDAELVRRMVGLVKVGGKLLLFQRHGGASPVVFGRSQIRPLLNGDHASELVIVEN